MDPVKGFDTIKIELNSANVYILSSQIFSCNAQPTLNITCFNPFTPKFTKYVSQSFEEKCLGEVVRISSISIFHVGKAMKRKFLHTV